MSRLALPLTAAILIASLTLASARAADAPASQPAPAAPAARKAAPANNPAPGPFAFQYDQMTRRLKLTAEQKAKLKAQIDTMNKDLEEFRLAAVKTSRDAIAAIEAHTGPARDKLRQQLQEDQKKASADYQKIVATEQALVNAVLTPDQRITWETTKLNRALQDHLNFALSDDQQKQLKPLIDAAAKELADAKDSGVIFAINSKLLKKLVNDILTEEQASRLFTAGPPPLNGLGNIPGPKAAPIDRNLP